MAEKDLVPEVIFSSPGLRALTTARLISVKVGITPKDIVVDDNIYTFSSNELLKVITKLKNKYDIVMIVGHNPAITDAVNYLAGSNIDNVPTCGVAVLKFKTDSWKDTYKNSAILKSFDYPKKLW